MDDRDWMAQRFEEHRTRLTALAARVLGSASEADDAVQEAWVRLNRSDADAIENLGSWLTTVVSRVCLNVLQARRSRPEIALEPGAGEPMADPSAEDPEHEALLAESIGLALLVVLDTLAPAERIAFVLHDMFGVPFEEIAPVVGRTAPAARQLASRARRRVRQENAGSELDRIRHAKLVEAFLAAARDGDFDRLLALLDPEVDLRADDTAARFGAGQTIHGALEVARFAKRAGGATPVLLDGEAAAAWMVGGRPRAVSTFAVRDGKIAAIDMVADPGRLAQLDLVIPDHGSA